MKYVLGIVGIAILGWFAYAQLAATPANQTPESVMDDVSAEAQATEETREPDLTVVTDLEAEVAIDAAVKTFTLDSFNYGYSEDVITVNEGDTVTINLTNSDGFHDWVVDEFLAATDKVRAGETTSVTFVADTAGTYEFYCSVGNHRAQGMVGTLVVQ